MSDVLDLVDRMAEELLGWYTSTPVDEYNSFTDETLSLLREYWGEEELNRRLREG